MNTILKKIGLNEKMARNFWGIIIIALGGAIIYGLPYFRYDYYDAYLEVYNLTDTQMGVFGSILGVFGMVSYLFGGIVADRFSTRTVLTVSLIGTGLGGLVHLLPLNYTALLCLYAFWGVSSLFAFWPCCVKAVRILSGSGDQGKAYGNPAEENQNTEPNPQTSVLRVQQNSLLVRSVASHASAHRHSAGTHGHQP